MLNLNELNALANHPDFSQSAVGKSLQKEPLGFIDIGARGGAHDLVEPIAKYTSVLGFEPDQGECQRLMQNPEVYTPWAEFALHPIALAQSRGKSELKLLSASTNHSLLYPNADFTQRYNMKKWQVVGTCELETEALDRVLFQELPHKKNLGEFLKIDTQGTEYEILQGAIETLTERTVALVVEVSFCELYKNQKLFSDIEQFLRAHGFSFYGFTTLHTRSKKFLDKRTHATRERTIYSDAIFFKDPLPGGYAQNISERGAHVLFTIALLLGFYDFAYELATEIWLQHDVHERVRIDQLIRDISVMPVQKTQEEVMALSKLVEAHPETANVLAGNFVDRRRHLCDYDDVLNVSPLPRTYFDEN